MKKIIAVIVFVLIAFGVTFQLVLKFPLWSLPDAFGVATGLSAKMACSGKYVNKLDAQSIADDLASYSPATRLVNLVYDDSSQSVSADIWGKKLKTASYRPPLGCTLNVGDTKSINQYSQYWLDTQQAEHLASTTLNKHLPWPQGQLVKSIDANVQAFVDSWLTKDNAEGLNTRALLIVQNGKIVAQSYASGFDENSVFLGWSMAKSLTAILIGNLILNNHLDIEQQNLFEQWQSDSRKQIRLKHLLTMTSGLGFNETYQPGTDSTEMLFESETVSLLPLLSQPEHLPGAHFSYSSGTSNLLAEIIHQHFDNNVAHTHQFLQKRILAPMGIYSGVFETDASGRLIGSSYFHANAKDWAKLALLLLNKGAINGHQLLSEEFVAKATQLNNSENMQNYGFQLWLNGSELDKHWASLPADAYAMRGNRSQIVMMLPSQNAAIVRLGWTTGSYPINQRFSEMLVMLPENVSDTSE